MDDLVIATMGTEAEYLELVEKFFKIVRMNNLRLKGKKCFFGARAFNFLGVKIEIMSFLESNLTILQNQNLLSPEQLETKFTS